MTVTPELRLEVSGRLREDFANGVLLPVARPTGGPSLVRAGPSA